MPTTFPIFIEGKRPGEFIAVEANGDRSRDIITLGQVGNGQPGTGLVYGGTVLGKQTATGLYFPVNPALAGTSGADGTEVAAAILYANADTSLGPVVATAITRDCTVNMGEINYVNQTPAPASYVTGGGAPSNVGALTPAQVAAINTQLAAAHIIARAAV